MDPVRRFEAVWCARGFLRELVLVYPVYAIMMGDAGVTPLQLSLLFAVWSGTVIGLEVPTGTLADRFSRKNLIVLSGLIKGFCFVLWLLVPTFWGFLVGFVVWGVAGSLASGTSESLIHDTLVELEDPSALTRVLGRNRAAEYLGTAMALAAGGVVAESGYDGVLYLSVLAPWIGSGLVLFLVDEPPRSHVSQRPAGYVETMRAGLREARGNVTLVAAVAMFASILAVPDVLDEYVGPLADEKGLPLATIGFVFAGVMVAATAGAALAHRAPVRSLRSISALVAGSTVFLLAAMAVDGVVTGALLAVYFAGCAAAGTQLQATVQRSIRSAARATITSIGGMGQELGGVLVYLAVGIVVQFSSWQTGLGLVAVASLALSVVFATSAPEGN